MARRPGRKDGPVPPAGGSAPAQGDGDSPAVAPEVEWCGTACGRVTYSKLRGEDFSELRLRFRQWRLDRGRLWLLH